MEDKKASNIALIATSAAAVLGIGFGVYGMVQSSNKSSEVSSLQNQLTTTITEVQYKGGPYIEDGYFYIPKWGVKYKLSDELVEYGFAVEQDNTSDSYTKDHYVVGVSAIKKPTQAPTTGIGLNANNIYGCSIVTIRNITKETAEEQKRLSLSDDNNSATAFNELGDNIFMVHDVWRDFDCDYTISGIDEELKEIAEKLVKVLSNPEKI